MTARPAAESSLHPSEFLLEAQRLSARLSATRRDLHAHPELGFAEVRTSGIVADRLLSLGFELHERLGVTGVLGSIGPRAGEGNKTVLLRFDMDALPVEEAGDHPWRSTRPGVMHACGHDAHVAIGLGVAELLAGCAHRGVLPGRVKLMFQPAEEGLGGARRMLADMDAAGLTADVGLALGLHVSSQHDTGTAVVHAGPLMGAIDRVKISVSGRGGHAAHPEQTVDAALVAAHLLVALQHIASRSVSPLEPVALSFGRVTAGSAANVIAERAELLGGLRCFTETARGLLERRLREVCAGVALAHGAQIEVSLERGVNPTVNAPAASALVHRAAARVIAEAKIDREWRTLIVEDFSEVLTRFPGCYFMLGARAPSFSEAAPHHSPRFDIDESCLPLGVAILCEATLEALRGGVR